MKDTELRNTLAEFLTKDVLNKKGQTLYSGIDTLRPGDFYFVGFNPAADDTNDPLQELRLHDNNWSAYTCQCWMDKGQCDPKICFKTGKAKHQKNVKHIMSELGLNPKTTFATNFVFVESDNVRELKRDPLFRTYVDTCWLVHKKMLAVVRPKYILCLGNGESGSAFSLVRDKAEDIRNGKQSNEKVGRNIVFKSFVGTFRLDDVSDLTAKVIGVLHPSRWRCPQGLRDWVLKNS